jgi:hypothetical protein
MALRDLARRWKALDTEIKTLNQQIAALVCLAAPELVELFGVGIELAGQFLVTAGDNPQRIPHEAAFAKLCGVAPQPASSGRTTGRHRLSRSGDRQANSALYIVTIVRMRHHEPTRAYVERRTNEGLNKREIIRCLKRYIARESTPISHAQKPTRPPSPQPLDKHSSASSITYCGPTGYAFQRPRSPAVIRPYSRAFVTGKWRLSKDFPRHAEGPDGLGPRFVTPPGS